MIADTTFLIDLYEEQSSGERGKAWDFLARFRNLPLRITIISAAELAAGFESLENARSYLSRFPLVRLSPEAAFEASRVDRELIKRGERLGENDTWIAGIARYYGEPLLSNDRAFGRVKGLKVQPY